MSTFVRRKPVVSRGRRYVYLQLVRNERINGKRVQRVIQSLGREDLVRFSRKNKKLEKKEILISSRDES